MATYTANYRLKKPGLADYYNIQDFNDNADVIDGKLKLGEEAKSLAESLQTSQQGMQTTLNGLQVKAVISVVIWAAPNTQVVLQQVGGNGAFSGTVGSSMELQAALTALGKWRLTYVYAGKSYSKEFLVEHIGRTTVVASPTLAAAPWPYIAKLAEAGRAREAFMLGDSKSVSSSLGVYDMQIIGFGQDYLATPTVGHEMAGLTFQMKSSTPHSYSFDPSSTFDGGWANCLLRTTTLPGVLSSLPADLQAALKAVRKYTANIDNGAGQTTTDKLFLPSEFELYGYCALSNPQHYNVFYEYYQAGHVPNKNYNYWTRSRVKGTGNEAYPVTAVSGYLQASSYRADSKYGLCFAFCV